MCSILIQWLYNYSILHCICIFIIDGRIYRLMYGIDSVNGIFSISIGVLYFYINNMVSHTNILRIFLCFCKKFQVSMNNIFLNYNETISFCLNIKCCQYLNTTVSVTIAKIIITNKKKPCIVVKPINSLLRTDSKIINLQYTYIWIAVSYIL